MLSALPGLQTIHLQAGRDYRDGGSINQAALYARGLMDQVRERSISRETRIRLVSVTKTRR